MKRTTADEKAHMGRIAELPCAVCGNSPVQVHHLPTQGGKRNHYRTIPLCSYHHTDGPYSEAVHQGRRSFESRYGTEESMWVATNKILDMTV